MAGNGSARTGDQIESRFHAQDTDLTTLHAQLADHQQQLSEARAKLFFFEEQARIRAAQLFGRHGAKWRREEHLQAILFNVLELELELPLQEASEAQPERIETDDEQAQKKKQASRAKREHQPEGGRSLLPEDLPRETTVIDIDVAKRICDTCGKEKKVIGVEVLERLQMKPIEYVVERTERIVRTCPDGCGCPSYVSPVP